MLAHQHSFGVALPALEKKLETFVQKFEEFDVLTNEGNYLQAREIVISLNQESQQTFEYINDVPTILTEIQVKLPVRFRNCVMVSEKWKTNLTIYSI